MWTRVGSNPTRGFMNREEMKALIRQVIGDVKSYLAISAQLNAPATLVLELVREIQNEDEAELWTMLVEP